MHFIDQFKLLWDEVVSFKRYKQMPKGLAVVCFILVLPITITFLMEAVFYLLNSLFFFFISSPINYLHQIMHKEGEDVKHATQFAVYWLAWPIIFGLYCVVALVTFLLYVTYFGCVILGYICSLCGFKFHITADEEKIAFDHLTPIPNVVPIVFISVTGGLLLLGVLSLIFGWGGVLITVLSFLLIGLFQVVYILVAFAPREGKPEKPKALSSKKDASKPEEPKPEEVKAE